MRACGTQTSIARGPARPLALAHKQLRRVPFGDAERSFIRGYGPTLASLMFYGGNSYLTPRDDAPRVTDILSDPSRGKHLHVGVARPRVLYVLYPVKDREVLCRGAVLAYHEFEAGQRLTDAEWKSRLDSDGRPAAPAWLGPILAPGEALAVPKR